MKSQYNTVKFSVVNTFCKGSVFMALFPVNHTIYTHHHTPLTPTHIPAGGSHTLVHISVFTHFTRQLIYLAPQTKACLVSKSLFRGKKKRCESGDKSDHITTAWLPPSSAPPSCGLCPGVAMESTDDITLKPPTKDKHSSLNRNRMCWCKARPKPDKTSQSFFWSLTVSFLTCAEVLFIYIYGLLESAVENTDLFWTNFLSHIHFSNKLVKKNKNTCSFQIKIWLYNGKNYSKQLSTV